MSEVRLTVGGREYPVACAEGEEAHVTRLGEAIDAKLQQMGGNLSPKEAQNLLFAALLLADELHELKARAVDADAARDELAQARGDAEGARASETAARTELENLRGEHEALAGELEAARAAAETAGTWHGDPDLPPALERFADLLENCADKLEGKAQST